MSQKKWMVIGGLVFLIVGTSMFFWLRDRSVADIQTVGAPVPALSPDLQAQLKEQEDRSKRLEAAFVRNDQLAAGESGPNGNQITVGEAIGILGADPTKPMTTAQVQAIVDGMPLNSPLRAIFLFRHPQFDRSRKGSPSIVTASSTPATSTSK